MNFLTGIVAATCAFFLGALWLHRRDEQALLDARIARDMAETERDAAQRSATHWQEADTQRQTIADLELSLGLDAAHDTIAELREELANTERERGALALQLAEATAKNGTHAHLPTRPKQGKPPYTISGQSDMAAGKDGVK